MALTPAIVFLLAAIATEKPGPVVRLLDIGPLRSLGSFSYSLYLVHSPIIVATSVLIVAPVMAPGVPVFLVTLAVGVPLALVFARIFAGIFDLPFQHHKSWPALRAAVLTRIRVWRRESRLPTN
jgi:peptidoglycan/LPS O-acetylase OafA/YrhL